MEWKINKDAPLMPSPYNIVLKVLPSVSGQEK